MKNQIQIQKAAQLNFSGPKFVLAKFWKVLKNHLAAIKVKG